MLQAFLKQLKSAKRFGEFRRLIGVRRPTDLFSRYCDLNETREFLRWIAQLNPKTDVAFPIQATHSVCITGDGKLHFICKWPELEGVEAARIRLCPARIRRGATDHRTEPPTDAGRANWLRGHCGRIFWVKMLGKRTTTGCCAAHTASIKMRRLREEGYKY